MFIIATVALLMGLSFAAAGLSTGIYVTTFAVSGCSFVYAIYEHKKEAAELEELINDLECEDNTVGHINPTKPWPRG